MLATALAIALVLPLALPAFYVVLLIEIAVAALFATAFNLLMGFGGIRDRTRDTRKSSLVEDDLDVFQRFRKRYRIIQVTFNEIEIAVDLF